MKILLLLLLLASCSSSPDKTIRIDEEFNNEMDDQPIDYEYQIHESMDHP